MVKLALFAALLLPFASLAVGEPRDGSHDFDFAFGKWKLKIKKLEHPLSGSKTWLEFSGTSEVIPLLHGKAHVEQLEVDSPTAGHIEGIAVRTYSPASHQWSVSWASARAGRFDVPSVGEFTGDRAELYDQEMFEGRMILVRYVWSGITKTSAHVEQSFSDDGGKTWEANWIADQTRIH